MTKFSRSGKKRKTSTNARGSGPKCQLVVMDEDDDDIQLDHRQQDTEDDRKKVTSEYDSENSEGYSDSEGNIIDNILSDNPCDKTDCLTDDLINVC